MKYCCKEFEIKAEAPAGFYQRPDGTWGIWFCFIHLKCCPFCGKALATRFLVEKVWFIRDTLEDKIVARFTSREAAQKHADKCK